MINWGLALPKREAEIKEGRYWKDGGQITVTEAERLTLIACMVTCDIDNVIRDLLLISTVNHFIVALSLDHLLNVPDLPC